MLAFSVMLLVVSVAGFIAWARHALHRSPGPTDRHTIQTDAYTQSQGDVMPPEWTPDWERTLR